MMCRFLLMLIVKEFSHNSRGWGYRHDSSGFVVLKYHFYHKNQQNPRRPSETHNNDLLIPYSYDKYGKRSVAKADPHSRW
jgi:hypothetical protein